MFSFFQSTTKNTTHAEKKINHANKTRKNISKPKVIIGKIYAIWCSHCTELNKIWKNIIKKSRQIIPNKNLLRFVSIEDKGLENKLKTFYKKYNITDNEHVKAEGYPTIFKIKDGKTIYYDGTRDEESLVKWITA